MYHLRMNGSAREGMESSGETGSRERQGEEYREICEARVLGGEGLHE